MHFILSCLKVDFLLLLFLQESKLCFFFVVAFSTSHSRCSFHSSYTQADNEVQITQSDILRNVFLDIQIIEGFFLASKN